MHQLRRPNASIWSYAVVEFLNWPNLYTTLGMLCEIFLCSVDVEEKKYEWRENFVSNNLDLTTLGNNRDILLRTHRTSIMNLVCLANVPWWLKHKPFAIMMSWWQLSGFSRETRDGISSALDERRNQWRNFVIFLCRQDGSSVGSTACLILNLYHACESDQLLGYCTAQLDPVVDLFFFQEIWVNIWHYRCHQSPKFLRKVIPPIVA